MSIPAILGAIEEGLIYALLALGVYISFRILDIPDLTVDGSFVTGLAVSAVFTEKGHPVIGVLLSLIAGGAAGLITGVLHTKMKIQPILAGIITMTGLYSINLRIMGKRPNISLGSCDTIFKLTGLPKNDRAIVVGAIILAFVSIVLYWFLKTQLGMSLRATGDNEFMVRASSIDSDAMKILGFALANGLVALSGGVLAQYQNFADANGGVGMLVLGLASIIIGEAIFGRRSLLRGMIAVILGAIIYRFVLAIAFTIGLEAVDTKLFSAVIIVFAIAVSKLKAVRIKHMGDNKKC